MITRDRVGTEVGIMTGRIKQSFMNGRDSLSNAKTAVSEKTRRAARQTDYYVHDNAWTLLAVVGGVAFVAGFLLSRRNQEAISAGIAAETGTSAETPQVREKVKRLNSWELVHSAIPLTLFLWKALQASRCARKGMV